jgi:hypothetical protein
MSIILAYFIIKNFFSSEIYHQQQQQQSQKQKEQQKTLLSNPLKNWSVRKNSKSILKNISDARGESQERRRLKYGSNQSLTSQSEKKQLNQLVQRKENLKTVAFGLTTNLDETVLV